MPIVAADIQTRFSTTSGSQGNTQPQTNPALSIGKYVSTTSWAGTTLHDLFQVLSGSENADLTQKYRCIFVYNAHPTLTWQTVVIWLSSVVSGGADVAIGVDPTAASAVGATPAQALSVADDETSPIGVAFSAPTTQGTGLSLGNIGPGQVKAFWVRRTATDSAPLANDGAVISIAGDTA